MKTFTHTVNDLALKVDSVAFAIPTWLEDESTDALSALLWRSNAVANKLGASGHAEGLREAASYLSHRKNSLIRLLMDLNAEVEHDWNECEVTEFRSALVARKDTLDAVIDLLERAL